MSADHYCLIHGLVLASEAALPAPRIEPTSADVTYSIDLGTELGEPRHSRSDDPDDPSVIEHWIGERLAVEFPGWATFELSRSSVVLVADETGDTDLIAHLLLDHVLPRIISLRGDLMLHAAGAVGPSGRAHLFLGATGAGKSTIVGALIANGWALLDDDGIRVTGAGNGFRAMPGTADVRLLPDSAAAVLPGVRPGRPMSAGHSKRRYAVGEAKLHMATDSAPIGGTYLLEPSSGTTSAAERLGFAEALDAIIEHAFHISGEPSAITRQAFERASAFAAVTPARRLRYPHGLDHLGATHELITELDGDYVPTPQSNGLD